MVWAIPFSLATTGGISIDFLSWRYLDVSVPSVCFNRLLYSPLDTAEAVGCPIRTHPDQRVFGTSPDCFVAYAVLHRQSVPRHPSNTRTMLEIYKILVRFRKYMRNISMKLVFQSSTIDVLPLKRTSIDFTLSKNKQM